MSWHHPPAAVKHHNRPAGLPTASHWTHRQKAIQALEKQDIHVPKTPLKWQLIATSGVNKILVVLNRVPAVFYILHHVCNYFVLENHDAAKLRKSSRKTSNIKWDNSKQTVQEVVKRDNAIYCVH